MAAWSFKNYYRKNKAKLLARRRARYRRDPKYKAVQVCRSNKYYNQHVRSVEPVNRKEIRDQFDNRLFTVGGLAQVIGRVESSIRRYERMGIIPRPTQTSPNGWRLYTRNQASLLREAFGGMDNGIFKSLDEAKDFIERRWHGGNGAESSTKRSNDNRQQDRPRKGKVQGRENKNKAVRD